MTAMGSELPFVQNAADGEFEPKAIIGVFAAKVRVSIGKVCRSWPFRDFEDGSTLSYRRKCLAQTTWVTQSMHNPGRQRKTRQFHALWSEFS